MPSDIECTFTPKVDPAAYSINIANDIMLSLVLNPDKKYVSFIPFLRMVQLFENLETRAQALRKNESSNLIVSLMG